MEFLLGLLIAYILVVFYDCYSKKAHEQKYQAPSFPDHEPPHYYGYKGGWTSVTRCTNCSRTGLYEDLHLVDPCDRCGGHLKKYVGIWRGNEWELKK